MAQPFVAGVQWHPEGVDEKLSKNLALVFMQKVHQNTK
jgi:gamma-glutamyl-gamma-aminobutyrate hydrolase PuuD